MLSGGRKQVQLVPIQVVENVVFVRGSENSHE